MNMYNFTSLLKELPDASVNCKNDEIATVKYLPEELTAYFSDEDMNSVKDDDTVVLSFVVKAVNKCTPVNIFAEKKDGTTVEMTYFSPVQWTSINIPMSGALRKVTVITQPDSVLLKNAVFMNKGNTALSDVSLKGGMWMLDKFDTYVLDENDAVGFGTIDIVKNNSNVYCISGDGHLTIIDVTDVNNPVVVNTLDLGVTLRQIALCKSGTDVMISARYGGAFIVDVSDTSNPKIRTRYDTVEFATGMHICGDYAFISCRLFGIEVVDISDLDNPRHLSIIRCGEAQSCTVEDGILYAGLWHECAVDMYDVTNPLCPEKLGSIALNGKGDGMAVYKSGDKTYLYAATGQHTAGLSMDSSLTDLRYGQGNGLDIFDVTEPSDSVWLSTSKIDGRYYYPSNDFWETEVVTDGKRIYVCLVNTYNGVYVFDATNPESPLRIANVNIRINSDSKKYPGVYSSSARDIIFPYDQAEYHQCPVGAVICEKGTIYIAGLFTGLHIFRNDDILLAAAQNNIKTDTKPQGVFYKFNPSEYKFKNFSSYCDDGQMYAVAVYGDYIYAADGMNGILVFDKNLNKISSIPTKGFAMDIVIRDGIAYVAQGCDGLAIYTINKTMLTLTKMFSVCSGTARQVRLSPKARFAAVHSGSQYVDFIELSSGKNISRYKTNTHGYFRNLSNSLVANRYIAFYGHGGKTFWFDFGLNDDYDAPVIVKNLYNENQSAYFDVSALYMESGYENLAGKALGFTGKGTYVLYDVENTGVSCMGELVRFQTNGIASGKPVIYGNKLILSDRINGNICFGDASDPEKIQINSSVKVSGNPEIPVITDEYVLLPLGHQGLFKFDVLRTDGTDLFGRDSNQFRN